MGQRVVLAFVIIIRLNKINIIESFKSNITIRLEQEEGGDDKDSDDEQMMYRLLKKITLIFG